MYVKELFKPLVNLPGKISCIFFFFLKGHPVVCNASLLLQQFLSTTRCPQCSGLNETHCPSTKETDGRASWGCYHGS